SFRFCHQVTGVLVENKEVVGVEVTDEITGSNSQILANQVIIATGGITGGDLSMVEKYWKIDHGPFPETILNGSHKYADGTIHTDLAHKNIPSINLDQQWHYAAGIP